MLRFISRLTIVAGLVLLAINYWPWRSIRHAPGVLVSQEPTQVSLTPLQLPSVAGCQIEAVAMYDITSRILHTKRYFSGPGSDLVPIDVAVAWGRMSDQAVLDQLSITQGGRFFFYRWENQPPIPLQEIISHAANMHLIAANSEVAGQIRKLRAGMVVEMHGYLVNVSGPNGSSWRTSLTRNDTGMGACEVFYVQEIKQCDPAF